MIIFNYLFFNPFHIRFNNITINRMNPFHSRNYYSIKFTLNIWDIMF